MAKISFAFTAVLATVLILLAVSPSTNASPANSHIGEFDGNWNGNWNKGNNNGVDDGNSNGINNQNKWTGALNGKIVNSFDP
ncbi:hypothetical protein G9A89_010936 [Geosiphon pyriformis]|nr:hypothetical protein G9A89_010936 [Geosiphon pyriformis]